jgi:capsular polysaccharide biosynthesis protein
MTHDPAASISNAKSAMKRGDFAAALSDFRDVDLATLDPLAAIRVLTHMSICANRLGQDGECTALQRQGLALLRASSLFSQRDLDIAKLGLMLSIGSHDVAAAKMFLPAIFPDLEESSPDFRIAPVAGVGAWCRSRAINVDTLDLPEQIETPSGAGASHVYRTNWTWHAVIPGAEIVAGWDFVIAPTGEVLEGANHFPLDAAIPYIPHALNRPLNLVAHVWSEDCEIVDEDVLLISSSERHHYGHWIADFLPRLRVWDRKRKIAISAQLPRKNRELLACFGVSQGNLIECDVGKRYKFRSVQIVQTGGTAFPSRGNSEFLYRAFRPKTTPFATRRLFLERDAGTRLPSNQAEVDMVLQEFGVAKVNPARLSYAEQAALLAETSIIVGAFGTELYCMLNMQPGTTVIELIWDAAHATVYGPTCAFVGINHHLILCERAAERGKTRYKIDGDIVVDCAALRERLRMAAGQ